MIKLLLSTDSISLDRSDFFFHFAFKIELLLQNAYNDGTFLWSRMRFFTSSIALPVWILSYRKLILPPSILKLLNTIKLHKVSNCRRLKWGHPWAEEQQMREVCESGTRHTGKQMLLEKRILLSTKHRPHLWDPHGVPPLPEIDNIWFI